MVYNFYIDWGYIKYKSYLSMDSTVYKNGVYYKTGVIKESMYTLKFILDNYSVNNIFICLDGYPEKQKFLNNDYKEAREHEKNSNYLLVDDVKLAYQYCNIPSVKVAYNDNMEADETIKFLLDVVNNKVKKVIYSKDHDLKQFISTKNNVFVTDGELNSRGDGYVLQDENFVYNKGVKGIKGLFPDAIPLFLAIVGDTSDNIEGVYRFSKDVAVNIANECKTYNKLEGLLNTHNNLSEKVRDKLINNLGKIKNNYLITNIEPNYIPQIFDISTFDKDFFEFFDADSVSYFINKYK